jgi:glycine/D-amino acid oxidase-like deaminating enzyme
MPDTGIFILGAGIIGLSTAFYLCRHIPGSSIHLVEPSPTFFASASGFASGILKKDGFQPVVASLAKFSFDEHRELAELYGGKEKWGYVKSREFKIAHGREARRKTDRLKVFHEALKDASREPYRLKHLAADEVEVLIKRGQLKCEFAASNSVY